MPKRVFGQALAASGAPPLGAAVGLAFVVGAVKLGGVPSDSVLSATLGAFLLVLGLGIAALLVVVLFKVVQKWLDK